MKKTAIILLLFSTTFSIAGTVAYTYDSAGRLTEAKFEHTGGYFSYEMDAAGNIKEQDTAPVPEPVISVIALCICVWTRRRL